MKKDCVYLGKCYAHGSSITVGSDKLFCSDGQWEGETDSPGPELTISPGKDMSDI